MIRFWSLKEFQHKSTRHSLPRTMPAFHLTFIWEVLGLLGLSSLKKHYPTAAQCPSHEEPHLAGWPSAMETLKHTHLYNSMTGFATSLYCLSLAATASGLSSSCCTNGSPVMSSIPYKYQRNQLVWPTVGLFHRWNKTFLGKTIYSPLIPTPCWFRPGVQ